jgi:K(+)-stimulated pyrophosphate-energized sodium pump
MQALNRGYYLTTALAAVGFFIGCFWLLRTPDAPPGAWLNFWFCGLIGLGTAMLFVYITQY